MAFAVTAGTGTTIAADVHGTAHDVTAGEQVQLVGLATGTLGALALATGANPVPVRTGVTDLISVTLSLDTSAYTAGDLIAEAQEVAGALRTSGGAAKLVSVMVIDEDDQGSAIDIYLTSASTTWGSENSAPSISDAAARSIQAIIPIASADYKDLGGVKVANIKAINCIVEGNASTSLYVAVVSNGSTPTYTASGVKVVFGFEQN